MHRRILSVGTFAILATFALGAPPENGATIVAVPFSRVTIDDAFWSPKLKVIQTATVEANLRQCELTGRIRNFAVAAGREVGKHEGALYNDSDVYKVIEGVAYCIKLHRDPDLEARADRIIDLIAAAQQPDGYLNTYYTLVKPNEKWTNLAHGHEMYCAGHLFEAAVAYFQATGKRKLLDVAIKKADHISQVFGPGKRPDPCGHQEIELALVKLWRVTGNRKYLDQAKFFLDTRGVAHPQRKLYGEYAQDHRPVREQTEIVGHAVRAMYQCCAMADVAAATGDATLMKPLLEIWNDLVHRKMYLTGGIGPSASNEGFTVPYDLPNDTAYAETCAAIGMALWNHRMFLMTGEARFLEILEREIYNGLLSGVSLSGDKFFYTNPLGSKGGHHRVPWFDCSCCPTNIVRYLPGLGERIYATRGHADLFTLLYVGNKAEIPLGDHVVKLEQTTKYPWDGAVRLTVGVETPTRFRLHLRVPEWVGGVPEASVCNRQGNLIDLNAEVPQPRMANGFLVIDRVWTKGDQVQVVFPMQVRRVKADPRVAANVGRVALMRGPIVYCLEGCDHPDSKVRHLVLPPDAEIKATWDAALLGGVMKLEGDAKAVTKTAAGKHELRPARFTAIPYALWDNRAPGEMVVWLPESAETADLTSGFVAESNGILYAASHCWSSDTLRGLNADGEPADSNDHTIPRMTWWPRRGTTEWLTARLPQLRRIEQVRLYWFDDTGRGHCRVPASWRLLYKDGDTWKPVPLAATSKYAVEKDGYCTVRCDNVVAQELRLEVVLQQGFSGGVLRWRID
jgi:DUF1680 family protein